jgi:hypothetical protein
MWLKHAPSVEQHRAAPISVLRPISGRTWFHRVNAVLAALSAAAFCAAILAAVL